MRLLVKSCVLYSEGLGMKTWFLYKTVVLYFMCSVLGGSENVSLLLSLKFEENPLDGCRYVRLWLVAL